MSFEQDLETIISQGTPAKVVFEAIHDGLLYVNQTTSDNDIRIEEIKQLMLLIREDAESVIPSGAEVTEAAAGFANLKARIDALFANQTLIDAKIEASLPVRVSRSRTEPIPITIQYEYNNTLTPAQSYTRQQGVVGVTTISWEEEQINGVPTGRVFNGTTTITTQMQPRIEVVGTLVVSTKPIRYVRIRAKRQGANVGNLNEIEVYVKNSNIARNASVSGSATVSSPAYAIDGVRNLTGASVNGTEPYIQIDLKTGRHDLTRMNVLLYETVTYDYVRIDVSTDANNWTRIVSRTNYRESGTGLDIPINVIYGSLSTYVDKVPEVAIGKPYTIVKSPIALYYDSDRALAKNISLGNPAYTGKGTHTVLNKRTVNGVLVYGLAIGWIRDEDNR